MVLVVKPNQSSGADIVHVMSNIQVQVFDSPSLF